MEEENIKAISNISFQYETTKVRKNLLQVLEFVNLSPILDFVVIRPEIFQIRQFDNLSHSLDFVHRNVKDLDVLLKEKKTTGKIEDDKKYHVVDTADFLQALIASIELFQFDQMVDVL